MKIASDTSIVTIRQVTKIYQQGHLTANALSDINLQFEKGEFSALVGPSGSGKTTLLNLIGALDTPTTGTISVGGETLNNLTSVRLAELRLKKIGFVFQDYNLLPVLSALENVEYVMLLQGISRDERQQRANLALQQVGLDGFQDRRPSQLSGGQQQRVAVARAIAAQPLLILADEPTANLDSETGAALIEMMLRLNRTIGTTFIFSTHDDVIMRHAARLIRLKDGKVVQDPIHEIS